MMTLTTSPPPPSRPTTRTSTAATRRRTSRARRWPSSSRPAARRRCGGGRRGRRGGRTPRGTTSGGGAGGALGGGHPRRRWGGGGALSGGCRRATTRAGRLGLPSTGGGRRGAATAAGTHPRGGRGVPPHPRGGCHRRRRDAPPPASRCARAAAARACVGRRRGRCCAHRVGLRAGPRRDATAAGGGPAGSVCPAVRAGTWRRGGAGRGVLPLRRRVVTGRKEGGQAWPSGPLVLTCRDTRKGSCRGAATGIDAALLCLALTVLVVSSVSLPAVCVAAATALDCRVFFLCRPPSHRFPFPSRFRCTCCPAKRRSSPPPFGRKRPPCSTRKWTVPT